MLRRTWHFRFNRQDPFDGEGSLGLDRVNSLLGHAAQTAVGFRCGNFYIQPALEFRLLTPDSSHLGKGVTLDQRPARLLNPLTL